jgi:hypothetical protein
MDDRSNERMPFSHQSGWLRYDPHEPPQQQRYDVRRDPRGDRGYGPPQQQHFDQFNRYGPPQQQRYDQRNHYGPPQQQRYDQFNHYGPRQQQRYDQRNHYGPTQQQQRYDQRNHYHNGQSSRNYGPTQQQSRPLSNRSNDREYSGQHRMQKHPRLSYQHQSPVQIQPRFQPKFNAIRSSSELVHNISLFDFQFMANSNISPFWNAMSKLAASGRDQPQDDNQIDMQTMLQHLRRLIQFTRDAVRSLRGIPLSLIAHAFAKIITTLQGNGGRDNCAMAAFRVLFLDEERHLELFDDLAKCIIQKKSYGDFDGGATSNTLWAYAKLDIVHQDLFHGFAEHIIRLPNLTGFDSKHLTNILWAFGKTKISHIPLFDKISDEMISDLTSMMS